MPNLNLFKINEIRIDSLNGIIFCQPYFCWTGTEPDGSTNLVPDDERCAGQLTAHGIHGFVTHAGISMCTEPVTLPRLQTLPSVLLCYSFATSPLLFFSSPLEVSYPFLNALFSFRFDPRIRVLFSKSPEIPSFPLSSDPDFILQVRISSSGAIDAVQ